MGSHGSIFIPDTEEFHSIVSVAEKLNEQVALMEEETKEHHSEELTSSTFNDKSPETSQNESVQPRTIPENVSSQSSSSPLPRAIPVVLHPAVPPGLSANTQAGSNPSKVNPPNLQRLQTELRDLRDQFDQMKSQHNKEIKLLMSELDEEKRIRLTLQMEVQRMKKHMSK